MTYPPPPGVPGDPGQQPMPDPYAPGGGFAPPPVDPYGTPPPTSDPYGTPPQMDPYGQPPQQDPYAQPQQDPYGSPPMSGVPMSPGAPGMAPDPYGQPQMGGMPGQPPSFLGGQPPPKKSNLGWILGGVGGAAVLIIVVVVAIVMFNTGGSKDDNAGGGDTSASEDGGEKSDDGGGDDGGSGNYKVTEGMCEQMDVSGVPSSFGISKFDDISMGDEMYCTAESSTSAVISVKGKAFADSKEAESGYEEYKSSEIVGGDGLTEFTGDWDKGEISQYASLEGTASVFIQDGNMAVTMFISSTEGSTNDEAKEAAVTFAAETFKVAAA